MAVDKQNIILIIFIVMMILIAGIIVTGLIPEIFRQGEQIDQALLQQHEDEARLNQTLHEDLEREKQFEKENQARDKQRYLIINETNNSLHKMETHLIDFIADSANRSEIGASERKEILDKLNVALNNQEAQLSKQNTQLNLLSGQQDAIDNSTRNTLEVLNRLANATTQIHLDNKALLENITKNIEELVQNR